MTLAQIQRQTQSLKLTPEQILAQKLLEMNVEELDARIKSELEENPALEEGEDPYNENNEEDNYEEENGDEEHTPSDSERIDDGFTDSDDDDDYDNRTHTHNTSPDDKYVDIPYSVGETFIENILSQFHLLKLTPIQRQIGEYIINSLDDRGFLTTDVPSITDTLAFNENVETTDDEVAAVLEQIKELDPIGVGCRNEIEYLILQLESKTTPTPYTGICIKILKNYIEMYGNKHFDALCERLGITRDELREADDEIQHLNISPNTWGGDVVANREETIYPDFRLEEHDGELTLIPADSRRPEIFISKEWEDDVKRYQSMGEKEGAQFCRKCIDKGKNFIEALRQRNETMEKVMLAIINYQKAYFLDGDLSTLKPMILQDIADITGYDVSTISRVTKSKHISTNFGTFKLRDFFSESMTNAEGDEVSTRQIRQILSELIDEEDKTAPLNDDKLVELMASRGYPIARRTVAKYRTQMGIPVARLRRQI